MLQRRGVHLRPFPPPLPPLSPQALQSRFFTLAAAFNDTACMHALVERALILKVAKMFMKYENEVDAMAPMARYGIVFRVAVELGGGGEEIWGRGGFVLRCCRGVVGGTWGTGRGKRMGVAAEIGVASGCCWV